NKNRNRGMRSGQSPKRLTHRYLRHMTGRLRTARQCSQLGRLMPNRSSGVSIRTPHSEAVLESHLSLQNQFDTRIGISPKGTIYGFPCMPGVKHSKLSFSRVDERAL